MMLPYMTEDLPGVGGVIKQSTEDFFVQELPAYEPSGQGEHVYCEIEKAGIPTFAAVDRIAEALKIPRQDIGYAGMKDARAVTRQLFSIGGVAPEAVMAMSLPDMTVRWAVRHGNKLRLGHLKGNRFAVKIRQVNPTDVVKLEPLVRRLSESGIANYFGDQRFGRRGDNDLLGAALIRLDAGAVLKGLLGNPLSGIDDAQTAGARGAFDAGDLEKAMKLWPRRCGMERRVLARLMKTGRPGPAVAAVDERVRRLWISAAQSRIFNDVVAARVRAATLGRLLEGDLAQKHDNGSVFRVTDPATEQPRCDAFEISPTGPMLGYRMTLPDGPALELEERVFAEHGLKPSEFRVEGRLKVKGTRRAMRVQPQSIELAGGVDDQGPHITVAFTLPAGSFATILLRELMKNDSPSLDAGDVD